MNKNKTLIAVLERALDAADINNCVVAQEHRDAVKLYLDSWVRGPIKSALAYIKGEKSAKDIDFWVK